MQRLAQIVADKSVALVGNSAKILRQRPAKQIDSADVVIRINRGLPQFIDSGAIGSRTTVWCAARYWPSAKLPEDCKAIVWMKLTKLGQTESVMMQKMAGDAEFIGWPKHLEDACREFVGADPGTGIRMLWWLRKVAAPRSVSCYGMDCWEAPSHWSGKMNTPNHSPSLEREAMLKLL